MDTERNTATRSLPDTMKAIAWSFAGLRRKKDFDQDVGNMNPLYVLVCGLAGVLAFILILLAVVHAVVP